jgi:hypothetical protein
MISHRPDADQPNLTGAGIRPAARVTGPISIVIPVVNWSPELGACLESLGRLDPPCEDLVVVVDGGSEETAAMAAAAGARVVRLLTQCGPAAARNVGARAAHGDVLCFLDSDVTVPARLLADVHRVLSGDPGLDAVIGSYDEKPQAPNFLSQYKNLAHHFVHQTSRTDTSSFWSGCGAIRRAAFDRVGGFDERFRRPSVEDIELGHRLHAAGCRVRIDRALQVTHFKRWTPVGLLVTEIRDRAIPWTELILRTGAMPNELNLRWKGRAAVAAAGLLALAIATAPWLAASRLAAVVLAAVLVLIDLDLYRFLRARRGLVFAIRAVFAHWVHYLCSAAGFLAGAVRHVIGVRPPAAAAAPSHAEADRT